MLYLILFSLLYILHTQHPHSSTSSCSLQLPNSYKSATCPYPNTVQRASGYTSTGNRDDVANGKDNVLRPEWISMFPSVHTVHIDTFSYRFKFRLEALLESMKSISSLVTVTVDDQNDWIQDALTDEISAAFTAAGWHIEYKEEHVMKGELFIKVNQL